MPDGMGGQIAFETLSPTRAAPGGYALYREGERSLAVHRVASGACRLVRYALDGRRHVMGFVLPGELAGTPFRAVNDHDLETVGPTRLALAASAVNSPDTALARQRLRESQAQAFLLGRSCALERMCGFLLMIRSRLDPLAALREGAVVRLPMDRRDIADFLGLTVETVCRRFAALKEAGILAFEEPRILTVTNPERLVRCAGGAAGWAAA